MFDLPKFGSGPCLERVADLLDCLGVDRDRLARRNVAVCGSNGKGSTAALLEATARAYGLKTGLFTSPHLFAFNERFAVNGQPVGEDDLACLTARVAAAIRRTGNGGYGAFEAQFALACLYFQESGCDLLVLEAGIGGRLDPVRVAGAMVCAVVSLDFEHTALLGASLQAIALDKSEACAAGGTVVYGETCAPCFDAITRHNAGIRTSLLVGRDIGARDIACTPEGTDVTLLTPWLPAQRVHVALPGAFQAGNAAVAASLFLLWLHRAGALHGERAARAIAQGAAAVRWPGRLETLSSDPLVLCDVGHTPDAITQILASLDTLYPERAWILVTGVSADKRVGEIAGLLAKKFDRIIATRAWHKGASVADVAAAARAANPYARVDEAATIEAAAALALQQARESGRAILVAGGLFLSVEFAVALRGADPAALRFF